MLGDQVQPLGDADGGHDLLRDRRDFVLGELELQLLAQRQVALGLAVGEQRRAVLATQRAQAGRDQVGVEPVGRQHAAPGHVVRGQLAEHVAQQPDDVHRRV